MDTQPYATLRPVQLRLVFDEPLPPLLSVNQHNLQGQNKLLYEHLAAGNTIGFLQARQLGIDQLSSRIDHLSKYGIKIYSTIIRIGGTQCKEYSLDLFVNDVPRQAPAPAEKILLKPVEVRPSPKPLELEGETWKDIEGYEGLYQVSDQGRVKSFKREPDGVVLKNIYSRTNGLTVGLIDKTGGQKIFKVHKLVAHAFLPKPTGKNVIIHKNCDHTDNALSNLKWGTKQESIQLAWWSGRMPNGAARGNTKLGREWMTEIHTVKEIAEIFQSRRSTIVALPAASIERLEFNDPNRLPLFARDNTDMYIEFKIAGRSKNGQTDYIRCC